jgi:hypothetical protein
MTGQYSPSGFAAKCERRGLSPEQGRMQRLRARTLLLREGYEQGMTTPQLAALIAGLDPSDPTRRDT